MLQRIGLCQSLLHHPKLLILDEPMSGLDPVGRALVRNIIQEEHQRGCTIFFSSHVLSDVEKICDRVAILVDGRLRSIGTIHELLSETYNIEMIVEGNDPDPTWECKRLSSGLYQMIVPIHEREQYIDTLRKRDFAIHEIRPKTMSLEEILVNEIKGKKIDPQNMGVWT